MREKAAVKGYVMLTLVLYALYNTWTLKLMKLTHIFNK